MERRSTYVGDYILRRFWKSDKTWKTKLDETVEQMKRIKTFPLSSTAMNLICRAFIRAMLLRTDEHTLTNQ